MRKPNLFLIGAMKSGTTTLHDILAAHPRIAMCDPKEPCYFVDPEVLRWHWPEMWRLGIWKDEAAYLRLFAAKPDAKYLGESSTDYSKLPLIAGVAERIAAYNREIRCIYIMRDPVERTISHYWHMVEHRAETRDPLQAIRSDAHYTDVSYYAYQLAPYISRLGRDRIYAMTFEELKRDPESTLRALQTWLDVDPIGVADASAEARNVTPTAVTAQRTGSQWLDRFRHSALWDRVGSIVPRPVRRIGVAMVERRISRRDVDMTAVVRHLRPIQREQTAELERLLGRRFDEWTTVHAE